MNTPVNWLGDWVNKCFILQGLLLWFFISLSIFEKSICSFHWLNKCVLYTSVRVSIIWSIANNFFMKQIPWFSHPLHILLPCNTIFLSSNSSLQNSLINSGSKYLFTTVLSITFLILVLSNYYIRNNIVQIKNNLALMVFRMHRNKIDEFIAYTMKLWF